MGLGKNEVAQKKSNCWEYMKCGRELGGLKTAELGVCPAAADSSFAGINSGENAGRFCWAAAGTFCGGDVQGTFAEKRKSCLECSFFKLVRKEEGAKDLQKKFLRFISESGEIDFLNQLTYKHVRAGDRFITQGEPGDEAYIIQSGTCLIIVEKSGQLHPVGHRGEGDIVSVRSLLTGEPRHAHVEAETDMNLWVLKKSLFDKISAEKPAMLTFMTEIVADRFDSRRPVSDRNIGKYIASDIIGRGGSSLVYKGIHSELNMPVAIKMMRHDLVMRPDFLNDFRNEARIIANLNHENIVRVFDIEESFRTFFIIMEYLKGESLKDMLKRLKNLTPILAANYLFQIGTGLRYAHEHGIVHRDINTLNIFVEEQDRVKILDFGLACTPGTEDSIISGHFDYQAPELIDGAPADFSTDIYALGITAYEMVTGRKPFQAENVNSLIKLKRSHAVPDPAEVVPGLPRGLRAFILKSCHREPDQRYKNINEALDDLDPIIRKPGSKKRYPPASKRNLTTLLLSYSDDHRQELNRLLEEFSGKVKKLGAEMKVATFQDP